MKRRLDGDMIVAGDIAAVPLSGGGFAIVDICDLPLVEGRVWHLHPGPLTRYAASYADGERLLMHNLILPTATGLMPDHRNGHGLDNRRSNLRVATKAQNAQNSGLRRDSTSGFKGVSLHKASGRWRALLVLRGRQLSMGYFDEAAAAAAAYDAGAREHFGEFAVTNKDLGLL